jgi:hypothetical protein
LVVSCADTEVRDLAHNETMFPQVSYKAKQPADRVAFVTPLVDGRKTWVADASSDAASYPVKLMPESVWARPLPDMIDEILRRDLASSGVFAAIEAHAEAKGLIVRPTLVTGSAGVQEKPNGRRTIAETAIRIVVLGPDEGNGKRSTLHDRVYQSHLDSKVEMQPVPAVSLYANTLRSVVQQVLAGLDQSNVARSGVPLDTGDGR